MPIVFACDCRRTITVPYEAAGLLTNCPRCGAVLQVPWFSDARVADRLACGKTALMPSPCDPQADGPTTSP